MYIWFDATGYYTVEREREEFSVVNMKSVRYVFAACTQRLRSSNSAEFIVNSRV